MPSKTVNSEVKEEVTAISPFVAPYPNRYRDKFSTPCNDCFTQCRVCPHNGEGRLKLLIVGLNPSEHAWKSGNMYSNPTNRMWKILTGTLLPSPESKGIIKSTLSINDQNSLPKEYGIGFCDVGIVPGNQSDSFSKEELQKWRIDFIRRLRNHLKRVCREEHNDPKCSLSCHAPRIVLFAGKKQFCVLTGKSTASTGLQSSLPSDWPFGRASKVFVCPSSSGRVVMKREELMKCYERVFEEVRAL
ncbi:hypothetical protein AV274_1376 [Blastocystis sp. ATCC 50177/Nand II]|uniref:Uracil-DNA glycosylase-like domain-containing protein n=1 Tax=Blastocystis sp. subtype 1 (strain ATCC 50177 / NandII) TaxID=478820 RepID=A0A196SL56_BLAHN|nr:hypothetical protein AV274_1376 [Blastocystis sp. ATCC 50177/Nand II]